MSSEQDLNGDARVLMLRIRQVELQLSEMRPILTAVRDHQLKHHLCPQPGMCLSLGDRFDSMLVEKKKEHAQFADQIGDLRSMVAKGIGVVVTISIIFGVAAPFIISHLVKH